MVDSLCGTVKGFMSVLEVKGWCSGISDCRHWAAVSFQKAVELGSRLIHSVSWRS